jgi:hypothetical protein
VIFFIGLYGSSLNFIVLCASFFHAKAPGPQSVQRRLFSESLQRGEVALKSRFINFSLFGNSRVAREFNLKISFYVFFCGLGGLGVFF